MCREESPKTSPSRKHKCELIYQLVALVLFVFLVNPFASVRILGSLYWCVCVCVCHAHVHMCVCVHVRVRVHVCTCAHAYLTTSGNITK